MQKLPMEHPEVLWAFEEWGNVCTVGDGKTYLDVYLLIMQFG